MCTIFYPVPERDMDVCPHLTVLFYEGKGVEFDSPFPSCGVTSRNVVVDAWQWSVKSCYAINMSFKKKGKVKCSLYRHWGTVQVVQPTLSWPRTSRGWGVSVTPRPLFTPGKDPVLIVQEAGWAPGPAWTGAGNLAPHRDSIPGPSSP